MTEKKSRRDVYQIVTEKIIHELEEGAIPWKQSWYSLGPPRNFITQRVYRGINILLLTGLGFEENQFITLRQLKEIGGEVNDGEKPHEIVFWNWKETEVKNEKGEKQKQLKPFLMYYRVYNVCQCSKIPGHLFPQKEMKEPDPIGECEKVLEEMPVKPRIVHKDDEAFYHIQGDYINMPKKKLFKQADSYYQVLFHELVHWTGHASRLNRQGIAGKATERDIDIYSIEELVAEIGASFLCFHCDLDSATVKNSAAYIYGYLEMLKKDKRFIFYASSMAQKAVDYILDTQLEEPSLKVPVLVEDDDLPF
jgi:antirestriction protein ArdC